MHAHMPIPMSLIFTKNETVKVTAREFPSLLKELIKTMECHIEFMTGDNNTIASWNQLLNDGIDQLDLMTVEDVGTMAGFTKQEDKVIGSRGVLHREEGGYHPSKDRWT